METLSGVAVTCPSLVADKWQRRRGRRTLLNPVLQLFYVLPTLTNQ